jgi:NitT/TauT family transport system substrate-binding protein
MPIMPNRRGFLAGLASASASLAGPARSLAQEAPPETTTIRLAKNQSLCIAPQYVAENLLRAEGFTAVRHLVTDGGAGQSRMLAHGEIDFTLHFSPLLLIPIGAGEKITIIAGVHAGCFELFATDRIRTIADLKGKTVGVPDLGASPHVFLSTMAAHVGLEQDRRFPWLSAGPTGIACAQDWPRGRQ